MVELPPQQPQPQYLGAGQPFSLPSLSGAPMMLPSLAAQAAPMLPSMDPQMPDNVAAQYGQQILQQGVAQIQQMMLMGQDFSQQMRRNVQDLSGVSTNIGQINALLAGTLQGLRQTAQSAQSAASGGGLSYGGGGGAVPAPTEASASDAGGSSGGDQPDGRTLAQRFSEGRAMANRQSMTGVSRQMAGVAAQALQAKTGRWETEPDENGNLNFHGANGEITDSMPATEENIAKAEQYGARTARATGLLGRYAQGESLLGGEGGLLGGLGSGVLKAAGPVGLAVGVAASGFHEFASQTDAGTQYRAAYGTDAGRFAITQRAGADMAGIGGYLSGIGFGRSKQNYETAASMGLSGDRLNEGTDFMNNAYLKYGLDTQTSAQAVNISAQNANISLQTLGEQIGKVSDAAVAAGKSSQTAITSFLAVTAQVQQGVTNTSAAPVIAGNVSTAIASELPSSLNTPAMASGLAGLVTPTNIALIAGRTGQNYGTLMGNVMSGQSGAAEGVIGGVIGQALESICESGAGMSSATFRQQLVQQFGNLTNLTGDMQAQVFRQYPNLAPMIATIWQQYGLPVTQGDAATTFFSMLLSQMSQFGQSGQAGGAVTGSSAIIKGGASQLAGGFGKDSPAVKALGIQGTHVSSARANVTNYSADAAQQAYLDWTKSTGNRDTAVEKFLRNEKDVLSYTGKSSLDDVKFTMQNGDSKSFDQILKDPSALAQFDQGTPYYHGKNKNDIQQISDVTHVGGATGSGGSAALGGGYTIGLTPAASRMFNLSGPNPSQSSGTPPAGSIAPNSYAR